MFDYILDLFGNKRQQKTRFTDVEQQALMTIHNYVNGQLDNEKTFDKLNRIRKEFYNLINEDGQSTIDQDTPIWMNSLFGYQFDRWQKFQLLKKHFLDHPEELVGETATNFEDICQMGIEQEFLDACKFILKEHPLNNRVKQ